MGLSSAFNVALVRHPHHDALDSVAIVQQVYGEKITKNTQYWPHRGMGLVQHQNNKHINESLNIKNSTTFYEKNKKQNIITTLSVPQWRSNVYHPKLLILITRMNTLLSNS